MNKIMLSWVWYLMGSFSFCAFNPSERSMKGMIEGSNLHGVVQDNAQNNIHNRIKALEIFAPLNEKPKYVSNRRPWHSMLGDLFTGIVSPWVGPSAIQELCSDAQKYHSEVRLMIPELIHLKDEMGVRLVTQEQLRKIIVNLLEFLQQDHLELYERLWSLSVLRIVQSLLPIGMHNPIREDPNTGGVSRGGLELFLLKELEFKPRVESVVNRKIQISPVDEGKNHTTFSFASYVQQ
ncbi:uncharacterized protein MELLADRAFT_107515 [Melampsora larici-populina 98AG31]|uniref:Secreted protein n=1 Tax=Melampsora larici-populina (strain 98AG31 / pathotype 3-4-7) TaxID=747676 RepID=F4RQI1_MELLP|nr:uncharacterized protein MELLADRAFT_107515 [Melampsora larici-populina 98AG31]EGG05301.1 hypothetical protein MELLADRAFT_107515 [Melampsora larici-populina 98AG31]